MKTNKSMLEVIRQLPEEFSINELSDRLIVVQKIEEGRQQIKAGYIVSEKDVNEMMKKWLV